MKSRTINPDLLPILTDTADGTPIAMPLLTQAVEKHPSAAFALSEQQCQQMAQRIFPQLETTLREALGSQASWEQAMQEVRNVLPELIRKAAQKPI
jgi:regulator of sirC expression with transglutaminase-like and TPR domain